MKALMLLFGLAGMAFLALPSPLFPHLGRESLTPSDLPTRSLQSQCRFEEERQLTLPADPGDALRVIAGSGFLEVEGIDGLNEVKASARACASHEEFLDDLQLSGDRSGDRVLVEARYPDLSDRGGWGNRYARLDLRLEVPEGMMADIRDSSGEIMVSRLGNLEIDDSSGEIEGHDLLGFVRIDDSSGEIVLWDVVGEVDIDDGSGEIELSGIGGDVTLEDGSGSIDVEDVEGTVRVIRDGSGDIVVEGVAGDFVVERDGSGSIRHRDVQGRVEIPRGRR